MPMPRSIEFLGREQHELTCWFAGDIIHWDQVVLANKPQDPLLYNLNKQIYMPFLHIRPRLTHFLQ